ncbi:class I tRNA ligase family protein [Staphylococcus aureus]
MYLEGSDQYRGWFTLLSQLQLLQEEYHLINSYFSHGFVMDGEGKKMSKSLGNVIVPDQVVKQKGADIARLWGK